MGDPGQSTPRKNQNACYSLIYWADLGSALSTYAKKQYHYS